LSHRRGTVEEKVLELQQTKRELADAIITADNSLLHNLTRQRSGTSAFLKDYSLPAQ
jgi:hypothetical protein